VAARRGRRHPAGWPQRRWGLTRRNGAFGWQWPVARRLATGLGAQASGSGRQLIDEAASGRVISADGTPIAWFRSGDGPPLLLIHGTTADHTTFRVVGPMFARRHAVFAMDRRGRGASGDTMPYSMEREFEDVAAVVGAVIALAGRPVDVLGHSYGGRCALGGAATTPAIRRLVLYESAPAPSGMTFERDEVVARLRELEAAGDGVGVLRTFLTQVVGLTAHEWVTFMSSPVWPARLSAMHTVVRELTAETGRDGSADLLAIARQVRQPVLQILGGDSGPIFRRGTSALAAALSHGRVVELPGQKHAAHHGDPDRFTFEVERFLAEPGGEPGNLAPRVLPSIP
jgi:pimeloyl-ACP methyl ester carboxylesterase